MLITYNEAPNIRRTMEKLSWAKDILIVDSFSEDQTVELVSQYKQARVIRHKFESFAGQCNYGLAAGEISTEWVLNLDADYVLTDELLNELKTLVPSDNTVGYRTRFSYCINGRPIRSGIYPPVTVLFRRGQATFESDGHAHRVKLNGPIESLAAKILHDDRKSLSRWLQSQTIYAEQEAVKLVRADPAKLGVTDRVRKLRVVAPVAMLVYCLIGRAGLFDGWAGFYYAFQRTIAELILSLKLLEADWKKVTENQS